MSSTVIIMRVDIYCRFIGKAGSADGGDGLPRFAVIRSIIKLPFGRMTAENPDARLVSIHAQTGEAPDRIAAQTTCARSDIGQALKALAQHAF